MCVCVCVCWGEEESVYHTIMRGELTHGGNKSFGSETTFKMQCGCPVGKGIEDGPATCLMKNGCAADTKRGKQMKNYTKSFVFSKTKSCL